MKNLIVLAALFGFSCVTFCSAQEGKLQTAEELSAPTQVISYASAFVIGELVPIWSRGYVIAYRERTYAGQTGPNLRVFDRQGKLVSEMRLWIDGASLIHIYNIAASSDGRLGVVGSVVDVAGSDAWIFADISLSNQRPVKIVHVSPFQARALDFAHDGSVWILGAKPAPGELSLRNAPDHFIVEHFSRDGVFEGEYIKRSTIPCKALPGAGGLARVVASDDRIGLFLQGCDYWVELKPNGDLIGTWHWSGKLANGTEQRVTYVALTSDDQLYAYVVQARNGTQATRGLFRLDRSNSDWIPVNIGAVEQAGAPFGPVKGVEGDNLVYYTTNERVVWAKVEKSASETNR
ncbi:MAG TPA: hypothetical protein VEJ47_21970 [Candidatus Eremiobacteraceae bacterium]|nr:hypothetical protein [Candidatus Eremiobacteraceae bacterium]